MNKNLDMKNKVSADAIIWGIIAFLIYPFFWLSVPFAIIAIKQSTDNFHRLPLRLGLWIAFILGIIVIFMGLVCIYRVFKTFPIIYFPFFGFVP